MLLDGAQLIDTPVMSLQTGSELARTERAIINPHDLTIIAFEVAGPNLDTHPSLLRVADIRELSSIGMIVDSSDEFVTPDDVIKLKPIYELQFELIGKQVLDEQREKVGKVIGYTIEADSLVIQQLLIKRPLLQSLIDDELLVHRSQIIEITDEDIIIKSKETTEQPLAEQAKSYINPFRKQTPQAEAIKTSRD